MGKQRKVSPKKVDLDEDGLRASEEVTLGCRLGWAFKQGGGRMSGNAELREFLELEVRPGGMWGFHSSQRRVSPGTQQDLWAAAGLGLAEGGDGIFLVALLCPAGADDEKVDRQLQPGLGFCQRRPEGQEIKPQGRGVPAKSVGFWPLGRWGEGHVAHWPPLPGLESRFCYFLVLRSCPLSLSFLTRRVPIPISQGYGES